MTDLPVLLEAIDDATTGFVDVVASLAEAEFAAPSRLPGWTRGHVVAHVILNAEAFVGVASARRRGEVGLMYPHGIEGRQQDIEALSTASRSTLLARLETAARAFADAWDPPPPDGACASASGLPIFAASDVPLRRLREVQVHLVDLGVSGAGVERWTDTYVEHDLPVEWATVALRTGVPVAVVDEGGTVWESGRSAGARDDALPVVDRRQLLGWVLDRATVHGLPELLPWGDRSRWEHTGRS